jgi:hypothetical protein
VETGDEKVPGTTEVRAEFNLHLYEGTLEAIKLSHNEPGAKARISGGFERHG